MRLDQSQGDDMRLGISRLVRGGVVLAVGIALGSCDTQDIGQGYSLRFADRGKTWIRAPEGSLAASGELVLSVWSDDEVIVYQVRDDPPQDCNYHLIQKDDGASSAISAEEAAEMVRLRGAKLRTSSSSSCPLGSSQR
jgi:hypothetical protein